MKLATWNVNSLNVRLPHVMTWLEENPTDVLCIQETKLTDDKFPCGLEKKAASRTSRILPQSDLTDGLVKMFAFLLIFTKNHGITLRKWLASA